MITTTLFGLVGGLGLFLFGIDIMAEGLQKSVGNKMRRVLEILTGIPIMGVIMGALVTAVIQSSSATTVMVVGFVNAGLMTLKQAVSVILGANIGTTVTAQLVAFQLTDYALPAIGIGVILFLFSKHRLTKYIGQALLGFGILFLGMDTMSTALNPLREYPPFIDLMLSFGKYPILGIIAGALYRDNSKQQCHDQPCDCFGRAKPCGYAGSYLPGPGEQYRYTRQRPSGQYRYITYCAAKCRCPPAF